jgi:hemerythrin superfamily protein
MPNPMDSMIAKGKGVLKTVEATLEGLRGVFRTLAKQHGEVSALLQRVKGHADKRRELWPKIRMELLSHERAEMREVYPVLRQREATRAFADHHDQEARAMEQLIVRLEMLDISSDDWGNLFAELADTVIAHANEEEQTIFPAAQAAIGEALTDELDRKFLAAKRQIAEAV